MDRRLIQRSFDDWQALGQLMGRHSASPNLRAVLEYLQLRWPVGLANLGCYGARPIRGSTTVASSHTYGAAIDVGYPPAFDQVIADDVCPWLISRSAELHIDAVHDYRRCRIWRAGRTEDESDACSSWWKAQRPSASTGMGQSWANHLHLEVTMAGWADPTPVLDRWVEIP